MTSQLARIRQRPLVPAAHLGLDRALLTAERSALNFLQTLSSTATLTRRYADAIAGYRARIMDTRKTLPGLRVAQKYAVTVGGGLHNEIDLGGLPLVSAGNMDVFVAEQEVMSGLVANSKLPSLTIDVSDGDIDRIAGDVIQWMKEIGAFWWQG